MISLINPDRLPAKSKIVLPLGSFGPAEPAKFAAIEGRWNNE
jgi:hypothetical protein